MKLTKKQKITWLQKNLVLQYNLIEIKGKIYFSENEDFLFLMNKGKLRFLTAIELGENIDFFDYRHSKKLSRKTKKFICRYFYIFKQIIENFDVYLNEVIKNFEKRFNCKINEIYLYDYINYFMDTSDIDRKTNQIVKKHFKKSI